MVNAWSLDIQGRQVVPELATPTLLGAGLLGLGVAAWMRKREDAASNRAQWQRVGCRCGWLG